MELLPYVNEVELHGPWPRLENIIDFFNLMSDNISGGLKNYLPSKRKFGGTQVSGGG